MINAVFSARKYWNNKSISCSGAEASPSMAFWGRLSTSTGEHGEFSSTAEHERARARGFGDRLSPSTSEHARRARARALSMLVLPEFLTLGTELLNNLIQGLAKLEGRWQVSRRSAPRPAAPRKDAKYPPKKRMEIIFQRPSRRGRLKGRALRCPEGRAYYYY